MNFSEEQIEKAKQCKTIEEFKKQAKADGIDISDEDAEIYFNLTRVGELTDSELNAVAGGKGEKPRPKQEFKIGDKVEWVKRGTERLPKEKRSGVVIGIFWANDTWYYDVKTKAGPTLPLPEHDLARDQ